MAQDPIKAARWDALVNSGVSPDEATQTVKREFATKPAVTKPAAPTPQSVEERGKALYEKGLKDTARRGAEGTAFFAGIPGAEEVAGLVTGLIPGGMNRQQGRQMVARKREEAKAELSPTRYVVISALPTVLAGLASGGSSIIGRAGISAALEGTRGFLGAGTKPADTNLPTFGERVGAGVREGATAAATGAAFEGALKIPAKLSGALFRASARIPFAGPLIDDVARGATGVAQSVARNASDALSKTVAPFLEGVEKGSPIAAGTLGKLAPSNIARALGRVIEPMDTQRIAKIGATTLPGRASSAQLGRVTTAAEKATASAKRMGEEATTAREAIPKAGKRIADKAKTIEKELLAKSEQQAATTMQQLKAEAELTTSGLRTPVESADKLREQTVKTMRDEAQKGYKELEKFPIVEKINPVTGQAMAPIAAYSTIKKADLLGDLEAAAKAKGTRLFNERLATAQAGVPEAERAFVNVPDVNMPRFKIGTYNDPATGEVKDVTVPKIDLEILDTMRQGIHARISAFFSGAETGLAPKNGKMLLANIDKIEKTLIDAMPPEAQTAVIAARAPYRAKMVELQAIQDGLNLFTFGTTGAAKLKSGSKTSLAGLEEKVASLYNLAPEAKAGFAVGAREAIANIASNAGDDAVVLATKLVGSPEARRRTTLALGKDAVEQLQRFLEPQMQRTAAAFAGPAAAQAARVIPRNAARAERVMGKMGERATALEEAFKSQAARAEQLQGIAGLPFQQIMAGGQPAETFAEVTSKRLGGFGEAAVPNIFGSMLQSELAGLPPKAALAKLIEMEANPAMRQQMGPQIRSMIAQITKQSTPSSLKTARQLFVGQKAAELTR